MSEKHLARIFRLYMDALEYDLSNVLYMPLRDFKRQMALFRDSSKWTFNIYIKDYTENKDLV